MDAHRTFPAGPRRRTGAQSTAAPCATPGARPLRSLRGAVLVTAALTLSALLTGCSDSAVQQATGIGSAVASGVQGISGDAVKKGLADAAGGIDSALAQALGNANITTDGKIPSGFPTASVPLVDGTVLGGGAGPNSSGWVVQIRVSGVSTFDAASSALTSAGYTKVSSASDANSAYGLFQTSAYQVILTVSKQSGTTTATYIVTKR